jgi:hypothetical protein
MPARLSIEDILDAFLKIIIIIISIRTRKKK